MSTRKSTGAVGAKVENADAAKDKDNEESSNIVEEDVKTTATSESILSLKVDTDTSVSRASTPTQKESAKAVSGANSNSRVTRNSPLLTSPSNFVKKETLNVDSEPTNSEGEESGQTKKQIRGRKSIKEAKESPTKDQTKENLIKPAEESIDSKEKIEILNKDNKEKDQKGDDKEKDAKNLKENNEKNSKSTEVKDCMANQEKDLKESKIIEKDTKDSVESNDKDLKDTKENKDKDVRDPKESKEKDTKDSKETKDKDLKEAKDPKEVAAIINRLTRNTAAQEVASNSRITRNRQSSAGSATRPETPPTARRGRPCNSARKPIETTVGQKRKRSVEEPTDSPLSKVIKTEPKDISDAAEEDNSSNQIPVSGNMDLEGVRIKQELIESDDGGSTITESTNSPAVTLSSTFLTTGRGRGNRWTGRKPKQTASPSTRSTRQNKVASPVTSNSSVPDRKRRRTAGINKRGSSLPKSTTSHATGTNATPDEDSKDSMASSMDDILSTDIKMEKLTPELEENLDVEMEIKKPTEEEIDEIMESTPTPKVVKDSDVAEPLTVETEAQVAAAVEQDEIKTTPIDEASTSAITSNSLNKDASLSPELVSEGVSEISVKQFYKRPKFLENNLGIEEDPKLGEIVQKVTTEMDNDCTSKEVTAADGNEDTTNGESVLLEDLMETNIVDEVATESNNPHDDSFSAESLKEGDLIYEESNDGKKTPLNEIKISLPTTDSTLLLPKVTEVIEEKTATKVATETLVATENEMKDEDEVLEERLVMAEEDLDDDDLTVEESETISMDNNPSLHDDAPEEEQDVEEESQVDELPDDVNETVPDDVLIDEITDEETKQTSNECDIEKAKLQEFKEEEIEEKDNEHLKVKIESVDCNVETNEKEVEKMAENNQKEQETIEQAQSSRVKKEVNSKLNVPALKNSEIKIEERKNKSIIVTQFDSDEKEPISLNEKCKVNEKAIKTDKKTTETVASSGEKRLSTTKIVDPMDVEDTKEEQMETDEIVKDEQQSHIKDPSVDEKMDISQPVLPKDEKSNSINSNNNSPIKSTNRYQRDSKDDDANSIKSTQSTDANSWTTIEPDCDDEEKIRQKEQHFKNLGLLTHKAAEKRRQEFIQTAAALESTRVTVGAVSHHHSKRNGSKSAATNSSSSAPTTHEYTGTLKTVIKLNRNSSGTATGSTTTMTVTTASTSNGSSVRKSHITNSKDNNSGVRRQSLKMTFQKGRGRGHTAHGTDRTGSAYAVANSGDQGEHGEEAYYTIQNENEGAQKNSSGSSLSTATAGTKDQQTQKQHIINNNSSNVQTHGRKPYNSRSNTSNSYHHYQNHHFATNSSHIDSSHSEGHHDGTTHQSTAQTSVGIISHKKDDREEILIPEKASSFKFHPGRLCEDQCYYCSGKFGLYDTPCHVGQIKSVERQQKILKNEEKLTVDNCLCDACFRHVDRRANVPSYKKRLSASGHLENINASGETNAEDGGISTNAEDAEALRKCVVPECGHPAAHSLRRKCIRKSVKKFLLNFDMPTGTPYIWLCQSHYDAVIQCSGCVLCKRRLGKNHMYHITSDTERLEKALTDMGIPVQLGIGTAVCKLCRYFANLLMKPPDSTKSQKADFVKNYRKRLLQFHNIHDGSNDVSEADEDETNTHNSKSNDTTVRTGNKASKTTQSRRMNKDQVNANSSTASSSSSVICMTENAVDHNDDIVPQINNSEKSQKKSKLLENEILTDYGMSAQNSSSETSNENSKSPIPSPNTESEKQSSRLKAILQSEGKNKSSAQNDLPCALLRANPNLSMRELFPGEEDLGLQFKAPFGSSNSQRTPEGWTRVQTFLQYDEPTRRLWEELQKPYGNQSSFLRHLILLEKYYRNGDLVLSANASSNASVYTQTVRQRLNSYDQGHCGGLDSFATSSSKSPSSVTKDKTKSTEIPLVEINDDDEEENVREDSSKNYEDKLDDTDVIMQETPKSVEKNPSKRRIRSVSVDKLTRQLSTNAVTIIARSKDAAQVASTSVDKSVTVDPVQKRTDLTKLQPATSINTTNSIASVSLAPLNSATTGATMTTGVPTSIASSSSNSRSILKSNLLGITNNKSVEILPIALPKSGGNANLVTATTVNIPAINMESGNSNSIGSGSGTSSGSSSTSKQQKILDVANKLLDSQMEAAAAAAKQQTSSLLTSPPELVSLQRRSAPNASSSGSATGTSSTMSSTTASLINAKRPHLMANRPAAHNRGNSLAPNVVILPNTLSAHERAESKSWRPTLMSVEENQHLLNKSGPLYQTADGRRLPGLVQVQSGGKPFLISIFDYNRMCILRREKLMRDGMLNSGKHKSQQQQNRHMPQSSNYNKMNTGNNSGNNNSSGNSSKHAQSNAAQQQFMQLLHFQKQQQAAAMKAANNSNNNRYHTIAPKQTNLSGNTANANLMQGNNNSPSGSNMSMNNASNSNRLAANQPNFPMPLLANALSNANAVNAAAAAAAAATLNNNPWLWSNFPDSHELLRNGAHGGLNKLPPLLPKPTTAPNTSVANNLAPPATITSKQLQQHQQQQQQQHHQMLLDNTLMSKIPKSLTVIPQHKLMGSGSNAANKE